MRSIYRIITHHGPHIDEIVAIYLLKKYGEIEFPGISKASLDFIDAGTVVPNPDARNSTTLYVGVGGGEFDEHPARHQTRKFQECAATLVAKKLGVENYIELQELLYLVRQNDLHGNTKFFELPSLTKILFLYVFSSEELVEWGISAIEALFFVKNRQPLISKTQVIKLFDEVLACWLWEVIKNEKLDFQKLKQSSKNNNKKFTHYVAEELKLSDEPLVKRLITYAQNPVSHPSLLNFAFVIYCYYLKNNGDFEKTLQLANPTIYAHLCEQQEFLKAKNEIKTNATLKKVEKNGQNAYVIILESDNYQCGKAARHIYGSTLAIFIQRRNSGQTQIFVNFNTEFTIDCDSIAAEIRRQELEINDRKSIRSIFLRNEGKMNEIPEWHYFKPAKMILNGTLTSAQTPPTKIPLNLIIQIVINCITRQT